MYVCDLVDNRHRQIVCNRIWLWWAAGKIWVRVLPKCCHLADNDLGSSCTVNAQQMEGDSSRRALLPPMLLPAWCCCEWGVFRALTAAAAAYAGL
jgi:hypothetical protein